MEKDEEITELWRAARQMLSREFGGEKAETIVNFWCYAVQRGLLTFESVLNIFLKHAQLLEMEEQEKK